MLNPGRKLKDRFLLLVTVIVFTVFLLQAVLIYHSVRSHAVDNAHSIASMVIEQSDQGITRFFQDLESLAITLAGHPAVRGEDYRRMAETLLTTAKARSAYINSVYYGSQSGRFLQRGWRSPTLLTNGGWAYKKLPFRVPFPSLLPADYDPRTRPWYKKAVRKSGFVLTRPYLYAVKRDSPHAYGISAALPVRGADGALQGVLGMDCTLSSVSAFVGRMRIPRGGKLLLFGPEGRVLLNPFARQQTWPRLQQDLHIKHLKQFLQQEQGQEVTVVNGVKMLLSFRRNRFSGFTLMVAYGYDALLVPGAALIRFVILIYVFSLIILTLVLHIGLQRLVRPINGLIETIGRFSRRDFNARMEFPPALEHNELGMLARTFNQMADAIKEYDETILKQHYTDRNTGLPNRDRMLLEITNMHCPVLYLVDIDSFKEINDFFGDVAGDAVLRDVAQRLRAAFASFRVYKLPADEYALLIDSTEEGKFAAQTADRIRLVVQEHPVIYRGNEILVQVTIGAAYCNRQDSLPRYEQIVRHADMALKLAKRNYRSFQLYTDKLQIEQQYEHNLNTLRLLKQALLEDRIVPVFQPIVNNTSRRIEKYECLVRIQNPDGSLLSPFTFLEIARKTRLYPEITRTMLRKALDAFMETDKEFSINLSVEDILNRETCRYIINTMQQADTCCSRLVIEIVESEEIEAYQEVRDFIESVKQMGVKLAIDDFGAGYSNFGYLLELNVDYIKIDASLIRNVDQDTNSWIVVKTIADFARKLGIKTIAEYVHSEAVYRKGMELGVDFSQGYYFGKPQLTLNGG